MALVLITHDPALVAEAAHEIIVMYAGSGGGRPEVRTILARRVAARLPCMPQRHCVRRVAG